jgi:hypothetical protein
MLIPTFLMGATGGAFLAGFLLLPNLGITFTLLLGALFPLITGLWSRLAGGVGRGVGDACGANALGTILGSAIGGLFILNWLGIEGSLYLASAISFLVAAMFWYMSRPGEDFMNRWVQVPLAALTLLVITLVLPGWYRDTMQSQVFRRAKRFYSDDIRAAIDSYTRSVQFLYYKEGIHGIVSVISRTDENGQKRKTLLNNGKADVGNSVDMDTQVLLAEVTPLPYGG